MPQSKCCTSKTVGSYSYTLVISPMAVPADCLSPCVYSRDDIPGSLYCFASGSLPVHCNNFLSPKVGFDICNQPPFPCDIGGTDTDTKEECGK